MSKTLRLSARGVAITGGARGIGRATAEALVREGARVVIGDIDIDLARETASELGPRVVALPLDVTDANSFERFLADASVQSGQIDVLINNAGIMPVGKFLSESEDVTKRLIDINVHGVVNGMKAVLPAFLARGSGHVINVASVAGKNPFPGIATYCGTKYFVVGVTEAARLEYRGSGVQFSLVMPNIANTELGAGVPGVWFLPKNEPEDIANAIVNAIVSQRFDVNIPAVLGPLNAVGAAAPRGLREAVLRWVKVDRALVDVDTAARQQYIERTSK